MKQIVFLGGFFVVSLLSACTSIIDKKGTLEWKTIQSPNKIIIDNPTTLANALQSSINYLRTRPKEASINTANRTLSSTQLVDGLEKVLLLTKNYSDSDSFNQSLQENFCFYQPKTKPTLFTGYYRSQIAGSKNKTKAYRYPIYGQPQDLLTLNTSDFPILANIPGIPKQIRAKIAPNNYIKPYFSRAEIEQGQLANKKPNILAWVKDPIELFFMHIQGSGIITFKGGSSLELGYANSNGWPYRSIGNYLVQQDKIDLKNVSKQSIESYLRNHPEQITDILNFNPSYVFFQAKQGGSFGNLNQALTPYRSVATDQSIFPPAALLWIEISGSQTYAGLNQLVLNQDVGGAIKGPTRVDLFCGQGQQAEYIAGHLKNTGKVILILPKSINGSC